LEHALDSYAAAEAPASAILTQEVRDAIAILTLTRPSARNSFSLDLLAALRGAVNELGQARDVFAIILTGAPPAFCAGHDLREMTAHRSDEDGGLAFFEKTMRDCSATMQTVIACPKPVIAAVNGVATAAGCQLVASCDLAVAGESARFATPGVNIGLFCSTPMVALSRNVSRKHAMEMLLTGELLGARRAAEIGLVNRVVADAQVMDEALAMANVIASKSPHVLAIGKKAFYAQAKMGLAEAYDYATAVMVGNMMARDAEEGIGAFLGKRKPEWRGC
jgi:enoyl-CoA hydratase/carnithine racemase